MKDRDLYAQILGIQAPWQVAEVTLDLGEGEVVVRLKEQAARTLKCPECGVSCPGYDKRKRRWRHLDTCQLRTILEVPVPRVKCPEHGVRQVRVPWAEPDSRFTALFEALVIDWLKEANTTAVSRRLGLSWDQIDGVMQRAVARGLARRQARLPNRLGVDETSFQKRHEYVTVVHDQNTGDVLYVADGKDQTALDAFYQQFSRSRLFRVHSVAMDLSGAYIASTRAFLPDADKKICFDRFHVAKHLCDAVSKVRREENRELLADGDKTLSGTKYFWLQNPQTMDRSRLYAFKPLRDSVLRTSRAWALKEVAAGNWHYRTRTWAKKAWERWYSWAIRSRLPQMMKAARMVKSHMSGILNAVVAGITNARAEGINTVIQGLKKSACGYRSRLRFRNAIYFHLGGLNLYPDALNNAASAHTEA
jgi:transposase